VSTYKSPDAVSKITGKGCPGVPTSIVAIQALSFSRALASILSPESLSRQRLPVVHYSSTPQHRNTFEVRHLPAIISTARSSNTSSPSKGLLHLDLVFEYAASALGIWFGFAEMGIEKPRESRGSARRLEEEGSGRFWMWVAGVRRMRLRRQWSRNVRRGRGQEEIGDLGGIFRGWKVRRLGSGNVMEKHGFGGIVKGEWVE
jgi:hypothetical protein